MSGTCTCVNEKSEAIERLSAISMTKKKKRKITLEVTCDESWCSSCSCFIISSYNGTATITPLLVFVIRRRRFCFRVQHYNGNRDRSFPRYSVVQFVPYLYTRRPLAETSGDTTGLHDSQGCPPMMYHWGIWGEGGRELKRISQASVHGSSYGS